MDTKTNQELLDYIKARGNPNAVKVLHVVTILHCGWEMDNLGWIVEMSDKSLKAFTTNHGGLCEWSLSELEEKIKETEESLTSLKEAQKLIKQAVV